MIFVRVVINTRYNGDMNHRLTRQLCRIDEALKRGRS